MIGRYRVPNVLLLVRFLEGEGFRRETHRDGRVHGRHAKGPPSLVSGVAVWLAYLPEFGLRLFSNQQELSLTGL